VRQRSRFRGADRRFARRGQVGFPWGDYAPSGTQITTSQGEDNLCSQPPLCEREAASAVATTVPMPNNIPCSRGCVVQLSALQNQGYPLFSIEPAVTLTFAKLVIDSGLGSQKGIDLSTSAPLDAAVGGRYEFKLDSSTVLNATDRVSFSALDASGNRSLIDQVLVLP
jgi:hypothetical protein